MDIIGTGSEDIVENRELINRSKHLCWIYEKDEERISVVEPFVESGLAKQKQVLLIVPDTQVEEIYKALEGAGLDMERYRSSGQIKAVDPEKFMFKGATALDPDFVIHRFSAAVEKAASEGWRGLTIVGDLSEILTKAPDADWLQLEFRADYECQTKACTMLCLYDARKTSGTFLASIIKLHPVVGLGNSLARNPFYATDTVPAS